MKLSKKGQQRKKRLRQSLTKKEIFKLKKPLKCQFEIEKFEFK